MNSHMKPKPIKPYPALRELRHSPGHNVSSTPATFYLMRLRSRLSPPRTIKRRLVIPVLFKAEDTSHAEAVKITHL